MPGDHETKNPELNECRRIRWTHRRTFLLDLNAEVGDIVLPEGECTGPFLLRARNAMMELLIKRDGQILVSRKWGAKWDGRSS